MIQLASAGAVMAQGQGIVTLLVSQLEKLRLTGLAEALMEEHRLTHLRQASVIQERQAQYLAQGLGHGLVMVQAVERTPVVVH